MHKFVGEHYVAQCCAIIIVPAGGEGTCLGLLQWLEGTHRLMQSALLHAEQSGCLPSVAGSQLPRVVAISVCVLITCLYIAA
jgi:hypothetical protein